MNDVIRYLIENSSKENIIDSSQLAKRFEIDRPAIRKLINKARSEGIPICSNTYGYYFSTERTEIDRTINSLNRRVNSISNAIKGLVGILDDNSLRGI